eukprot:TRINITY_DN15199_c0_g1_i1.p1 TRINITY_DN15199_c0_g1~~TRINITY_DN15199_c0_g1_i1.p1  ORF type:complete len:319 (+),score=47.13 TRINITY_DN15199_c0_g1_i1:545-1501(+)
MEGRGVLVLIVALSLLGTFQIAQSSGVQESSLFLPAFLWSDQSYFDGSHHTKYETMPAESVMKGLLHGLVQASNNTVPDTRQPALLLVFVGQQIRTKHLGGPEPIENALAPLKKVLVDSESSLVLPYVTLSTKRAHLAVALQQGLSRAAYQGAQIGQVAIAGPCAAALAETELISTADVRAYLGKRAEEREAGSTDVLVVCSSAAAGEGLSEADALVGEVGELADVHEAVKETTSDYLAAYLTDPSDGTRLGRTHRVLQALNEDPAAGNATTCNELCKTKAVIIETALIGLLLIVILLCGLSCEFQLDTPTKFEVARD